MVGVRTTVVAVWLAAGAVVWADSLPAYKIGDTAEGDIITPVPLVVLDAAATAALKQRTRGSPLPVVRLNVGLAAEVESQFNATVAGLRSNFLSAMHAVYPLSNATARNLTSKRFSQLTNSFQQTHAEFPLNGEIVRVWALGDDDAAWFGPLADRLRATMERPLLPDELPGDVQSATRVQLVYASAEGVGEGETGNADWLTSVTNLLSLTRARENFLGAFPDNERTLAAFAATFLRANCSVEASPPATPPDRLSGPLVVADWYEAGEAIIQRGQVIDARALAALAQLREKFAVGELQQQVATSETVSELLRRQNWWLLAAVLTLAAAFVAAVLRLTRQRQTMALAPLRGANEEKLLLVSNVDSLEHRGAEMESGSFRGDLAAQLTRLLGSRLVRILLSQRSDTLATQQQAVQEITEMESRLEQIHTPLRERLHAYEQRIAELERDLARKGAENRELIKAKIELTRRQLETERARYRVELN